MQSNLLAAWVGILLGLLSGIVLGFVAGGVLTIVGGITASSLPQEAREHCNTVVTGEGEPLWPEVLRDFENGCVKPFYGQSPPRQFDLRDTPMPRFDSLDLTKYNLPKDV